MSGYKTEVADSAGFCFGVRRAVKTVEELYEREREKGTRIFTLGELIHNPHTIRELEKKGIRSAELGELEEIAKSASAESPCIVVVRTHGITKQTEEFLNSLAEKNPYFSFVDCTCPYVKKIHDIVRENTTEDGVLAVFGDKDHPEVKGIVSWANGEVIVDDDPSFPKLAKMTEKPLIIVAQTTQNLVEWSKSEKNFKKYCTNAKIFDTICRVTKCRQSEAEALSKRVDVMLIIGGKNSSNTNKLYATAKKNLASSYLIEDATEIPFHLISPGATIGITAGASTPDGIIEEVKRTMSENAVVARSEQDFEEMLNESFKTLNTGDVVKGVIIAITPTEVHVDLSAKVTGVIPTAELTKDNSVDINELYKVGDEFEAVAVRVSDVDGVAVLSRRSIERKQEWQKIVDACNEGTVLEGKITEVLKSGVIISLGFTKAFIPASQTGIEKEGDLNVLLGTTQKVQIIEINEQRNRAVASIRRVQRAEKKAAEAEFWASIYEGQKFEGKVKSIASYGAFVDLGAFDGLVHVTELSWNRIKDPSEVVKVGDTINVFVKSFDAEKKRVSLGCKTEEERPFNVFMSKYAVGDVVNVKIVGITSFGAFAEIIPGVDGLIHISQLADKRVADPKEIFSIGDTTDAKITAVDEEKQKISLSVRALFEAAEEAAEEVEETVAEDAE